SWVGVWPVSLSVDGRGPRVVLAILVRERIDQAPDAAVADFLGKGVAGSGGEARAADLDVVHLPARGGPLHLVIDGYRLSPRLPDFGPDGDLRVAGLGPQGLELDDLVAVVDKHPGIRAPEKWPDCQKHLLPLLCAGACAVGANHD